MSECTIIDDEADKMIAYVNVLRASVIIPVGSDGGGGLVFAVKGDFVRGGKTSPIELRIQSDEFLLAQAPETTPLSMKMRSQIWRACVPAERCRHRFILPIHIFLL